MVCMCVVSGMFCVRMMYVYSEHVMNMQCVYGVYMVCIWFVLREQNIIEPVLKCLYAKRLFTLLGLGQNLLGQPRPLDVWECVVHDGYGMHTVVISVILVLLPL